MGMTEEQYWDKSPYLAVAYRKAYKLQRKAGNEQAWLQGIYFFDAVSAAIGNAMAKKNAKRLTYLERPIDIFPLSEREKKQREQEEYAKMQMALETMVRKQRRQKKQKGD